MDKQQSEYYYPGEAANLRWIAGKFTWCEPGATQKAPDPDGDYGEARMDVLSTEGLGSL